MCIRDSSSHINLVGAEIEMLNLPNREKILKEVLTPLKKEYDYIPVSYTHLDVYKRQLLISIKRMNDTKVLIEKIKEGIQEKKGKNIIIADLTNICLLYTSRCV